MDFAKAFSSPALTIHQFFPSFTKYLLSPTSVTKAGNPLAKASNNVNGCPSLSEGRIKI
jgi:hypothetical protein